MVLIPAHIDVKSGYSFGAHAVLVARWVRLVLDDISAHIYVTEVLARVGLRTGDEAVA